MDTTTTTRTENYSFFVTPEAAKTICRMHEHVQQIGAYYGTTGSEYANAAASLGQALSTVFGRPIGDRTTVGRDGDLSLIAWGGMTFGIIWHPHVRTCSTEGCGARIEDDGKAWTWSTDLAPMLDHEHEPSRPLDAPAPGTWSFHS